MSGTSIEASAETPSKHGSSNSLTCPSRSNSFENLHGSHPQYQDSIVTIEELRAQLNSCFTCGVSWIQEHVTLDCPECGDYPLERPCPMCNGRCRVTWKRNVTASHTNRKARWTGECGFSCNNPTTHEDNLPSLEKLRATT
ncbi:hypothetical protein PV327_005447 [Microctonus hyperodae]|uniref:Protein pinocchio n=1 Tax=Microctonus hyperodae TaxID=165561 RepID=A0AA39G2T6_MICHY|nr:hypothetical protein PV327_005447 [Microctonus hyperodae]